MYTFKQIKTIHFNISIKKTMENIVFKEITTYKIRVFIIYLI